MTTVGLIGAGHIGTALATTSLDAGYDVVIANSRGPETLTELIDELQARPTRRGTVRAGTAEDVAAAGDFVVVTVPMKNYRQVPVAPLTGKVVIDTNNYYPQRDGQIAELDDESTTTAELLAAHLPGSQVVKAFNHIYATQIETQRTPPGTPRRRALAIAGDDADAKALVTRYIDELGFDVLDLGPLAEGWRIQRDTPGYGPEHDLEGLRQATAAARRYRDLA